MAFKNQILKDQHERSKLCSKQCSKCFTIFSSTPDLIRHLQSSLTTGTCGIKIKESTSKLKLSDNLLVIKPDKTSKRKRHDLSTKVSKLQKRDRSSGRDGPSGRLEGRKKIKNPSCCEYCPEQITSRSKLLHHQRMEHFRYMCPLCKEPQNGIETGQLHIHLDHGRSREEAMLLLPADTAPSDIDLPRRLSLDLSEICIYCGKEFDSKKEVINHQKVNHIRYVCPICTRSTMGIYSARRHLHKMHGYAELDAMFMELEESGRPIPTGSDRNRPNFTSRSNSISDNVSDIVTSC